MERTEPNPRLIYWEEFALSLQEFFQEWSVNWQFLPEWLFLNKAWAIGLLMCQLFTLYMFCQHKWTDSSGLIGLFAAPKKAIRNKPLDVSSSFLFCSC